MSHNKLRKETNCLNCDAQVDGRYCKNCGQENVEPKQSLWHLITHFFNDITHFDGKFFSTMKLLLLWPGFLSAEYVKGRRMKYLDPVRMYLFISAAFFILMLSIGKKEAYITKETHPKLTHIIDSALAKSRITHIDTTYKKDSAGVVHMKVDTVKPNNGGLFTETIDKETVTLLAFPKEYRHGIKYYDSVERTLPDSMKSDEVTRYFEKKFVAISPVYDRDPYNFFTQVQERFKHSVSKIFFISLPIFAALLFFLYIRRRKGYYFVSHAIFALHFYSVAFFFLLFPVLTDGFFPEATGVNAFASLAVYVGLQVYLFIAMLRFYKQHWFKTLIKFFILSIAIQFIVLLIVLVLLFQSFISMGGQGLM